MNKIIQKIRTLRDFFSQVDFDYYQELFIRDKPRLLPNFIWVMLLKTVIKIEIIKTPGMIINDLEFGQINKEDLLLTLVDSAYEIVEMYEPDTPMGKVWKARWLYRARKVGAGGV